MKLNEIGSFYCSEMLALGKKLHEITTETRREVCFQWKPSTIWPRHPNLQPETTINFRRGNKGCIVDFFFFIRNAQIVEATEMTTIDLQINGANWQKIWTSFSGEPEYLVKAAANHNAWLDNFLQAVAVVEQSLPLTDESEIMGKKLWMWKPITFKS